MFLKAVTPNFQLDAEGFMANLAVWTMVTWMSLGFLRRLCITAPVAPKYASATVAPPAIGFTEVATVLVLLNAMFALFVAIQFRYLFGGASMVQLTPDLSYADYARKGFFELLTVVALALPLLIGAHNLVPQGGSKKRSAFRLLGGVMVVLLFIVAISALQRMRLYVDAYSLSPLRLYASAGMVYLLTLLALFLGTTLLGRSDRFALGALGCLALVVGGLNFVNPDAQIARYNLSHGEIAKVDANLLGSLSADATPVLLESFDRLPRDSQITLSSYLVPIFEDERHWASFNAGWLRGFKAFEPRWSALQALCKSAPTNVEAGE
jgi:hypothetical protein